MILLFIAPAITMKLLSEEHKQGTFQLHYTSPIRISEITIGKFLGAIGFAAVMLAVTLIYPVFMIILSSGEALPLGSIIGSYLGVLLSVGGYLAIGLFFSAMTENQIIALILGFLAALGLWLIYFWGQMSTGYFAELITYISIIDHFNSFSKGLIETKDLIYFFSFIGFFLFCTYLILESKRWR
jgi:ABC-2 type transport system permease protein